MFQIVIHAMISWYLFLHNQIWLEKQVYWAFGTKCKLSFHNFGSLEFSWTSFADEHNNLPKSTWRNIEFNKFAVRTPWLPELLCKHWFISSVWNYFCFWVVHIPPCETFPEVRREEKGLFLQAIILVDCKQKSFCHLLSFLEEIIYYIIWYHS